VSYFWHICIQFQRATLLACISFSDVSSYERQKENIRVFDWKLSAEQFQALNVLMPQISILADD
jgi:diketogulonate reductase-like aldo/keto reductase